MSRENAPRPRAKKKAMRSHLEVRWIREWQRQGGPQLAEEFVFHPVRKWRADFAHPASKTLIEIEGGAAGGRHTRKKGFEEDMAKYLTAHLYGWEVVRIGAKLVRGDIISAVIGRMRQKCAETCEQPAPGADKSAGGVDETWLAAVCDEGEEMPGDMLPGSDGEAGPEWLRFSDD